MGCLTQPQAARSAAQSARQTPHPSPVEQTRIKKTHKTAPFVANV